VKYPLNNNVVRTGPNPKLSAKNVAPTNLLPIKRKTIPPAPSITETEIRKNAKNLFRLSGKDSIFLRILLIKITFTSLSFSSRRIFDLLTVGTVRCNLTP
jgi:hypothetical protein